MKIKLLMIAFAFSLAMPAAAEFTTVEEAYEVALSNLRLPRNEVGTIAFKTCETCDYMTKRVNADTRYNINGKSVKLSRFRAALAGVKDRSSEAITVLHHLERNQVTAVSVYL